MADPKNAHTYEEFKELIALPLDRKIGIAQARIAEFYNHFNGQVYISFSGGKDSTVLLHIARQLYPDIPAVFCDTGLEFPEIRDFVKTFDNVTWLKPEKPFTTVIKEHGYPVVSKEVAHYIDKAQQGKQWALKTMAGLNFDGTPSWYKQRNKKWAFLLDAPFKISADCCTWLKKKPFKKYTKETGRQNINGVKATDSLLRKTKWVKNGCNTFKKGNAMSRPLSVWTEQDILAYCKAFNLPLAKIYGDIVADKKGKLSTTGESRTGCMFCMFGQHLDKVNSFQRMKITHPKQYDYCINHLKLGEVMDFVGVKYK